ncbi:hypothetical protein GCM10010912_16700 [Paenibacillus albidus]|uniref:Replicative helicase inhibitor G39P N-terminal domain-containing protein n=1 Tax=Paenibacillus albidus TaxID=2041023 RepID=A0A917C5U3_9BACL|nr:hypothetical protein [Paenibacillus albidus]GGF72254.1 hypothetical protein GCM10010912_16700 [Paenibacillus albidus]
MHKGEVAALLIAIRKDYEHFDTSDESIERHLKYLRDFPLDQALRNVAEHVLTSDFPPRISQIRGRIGSRTLSEQSKEEAEAYMQELESFEQTAVRPSDEIRRRLSELRSRFIE